MKTSRRDFLLRSVLATAGLSGSLKTFASKWDTAVPADEGTFKINIFSKHLQWLDYNGMASLAAEIGFEGVDITVRPEGHVLPERVADDLPKAVEAVKKTGLNVFMITTAINNADDPFTEAILKTAGSLAIPFYRTGWLSYDEKKSIPDNLRDFQIRMEKLAALNQKYNIHGDYQNHSGIHFGAPVWDLWTILKELDPRWMGIQYDILHATIEGANSWPLGLRLLRSHVRTMDIKDFHWAKKEEKWNADLVPLGQGMIDYKKYLGLVKEYELKGPFCMHFEYPLGGVEHGAKTITLKRADITSAMKRDLNTFKELLAESGLRQ